MCFKYDILTYRFTRGEFMKKKILLSLFVFVALLMCVGTKVNSVVMADTDGTLILQSDDYRLNSDYLDFYAVDSAYFSYSNNGGARDNKVLANAFDRNTGTYFESKSENVNGFVNSIEVEFSSTVNLDRVIYGSEGGATRGYPTTFAIYYKTSSDWVLIKEFVTTETTDFTLFTFGQTIKTSKIRLDFKVVSTHHRYTATAREIYFLQPENECYEDYANFFTDYSETTLNSKFSTIESIENFENKLHENINFTGENRKIERAKSVVYGKVYFDSKNEFSTSSTADNVIERYGDTASYARNTLQLTSFGTNRQVTGLLAYAGDIVTVYVTANSGDPLPKIRFSQAMGHWRSWLSNEYQLVLGKNTFTVPNFYYSEYTIDVPLGGAIYLVNPYTEAQQSSNVKVYIEGGESYPIFKAGMDEKEYVANLKIYANKCKADSAIVDMTEIVSDHAFVTVNATRASEIFASYSPNTSINSWNSYMDKLLIFAGIPQESSDPLFDEKNLHIRHNLRIAQPWAGAFMYAGGEHVGILQGSQNALIYGSGFGWGVTHELGHALDNSNRTIGETSNNMWSKYNEAMIENVGTRGFFDDTTKVLSGDLKYNKYDDKSYFNSNRYNYLVWWYIETWQEGYWGKLENCYRGLNATLNNFYLDYPDVKNKVNNMTETERQVFYSSIITGVDLTYYFDRWGYTIRNSDDDPVFQKDTVTGAYKDVMEIAINNGYVDDDFQPKLWYQNNSAHKENCESSVYNGSEDVSISSVTKTSSGYNIFIKNNEPNGHLGYEIMEGSEESGYKVIGFSYSKAFVDTNVYSEGYTPSYKVVALDKAFGTSNVSHVATVVAETEVVCKVGEIGYTSLLSAVEDANDGDTIYLLKSFKSSMININKNLIIVVDESVTEDIVITKIQSGNLFAVGENGSLTLKGKEGAYIVLDGNGFSQNGALLYSLGQVTVEYVKMQNNYNTGNGGAIHISVNNRNKTSTFNNVVISNNTANEGSAYYADVPATTTNMTNVYVNGNTALKSGVIKNKGTLNMNSCEITNNVSVNGVIVNYDGGILRLSDCSISSNSAKVGAGLYLDGYTEATNTTISNNIASELAGGMYYVTSVSSRKVSLTGVAFESNKANGKLDDMCISGISVTLNNVTTSNLSKITLNGGTLNVNSDCNLASSFVIKNGTNLCLVGGLFEGIENSNFDVTDYAEQMVLMVASGYNFAEADLDKINSTSGLIFAVSQNSIIVSHARVTITLIVGEDTQTLVLNYGQEIPLDISIGETKYIEKFVIDGGNEIASDEIIYVTSNMTIEAVIKDKFKVTFVYANSSHEEYYIPYSIVTLPSELHDNITIKAWHNGNEYFTAGQDFVVVKNVRLEAKYETLFKLVIKTKDGKILFEKYCEYGEIIDIKSLNLGEYAYSKDGKMVADEIKITADTTILATAKGFDFKIVVVAVLLVLVLVISATGVAVVVKKKAKK